jgi:serine protease inhibitor
MNAVSLADESIRKIATANTRFGFRLLAQLVAQEPDKNVLVSPSSLAIALAMLLNGAAGSTKQAMAEALTLTDMSLQDVNGANAALRRALTQPDHQLQLFSADSLWAKQGIAFNPEFIHCNQDYYEAEVANLKFTDPGSLATINGWVNQKTNGKINDLVKPLDLIDTILILINALYFKGLWRDPFDPEETMDGWFNLPDGGRKLLPLMRRTGRYNYYESQTFQAAGLPYGSGRLSMDIFLPEREAMPAFQLALTGGLWKQWLAQFRPMEGTITMPRFKVEYEAELSPALKALGMGEAFELSANFKGICPDPLRISKVRHKTLIEVNEAGTEAAAASAVIVARYSIEKRFNLVVDRPFFLAIYDHATEAVLFAGYVVDPM